MSAIKRKRGGDDQETGPSARTRSKMHALSTEDAEQLADADEAGSEPDALEDNAQLPVAPELPVDVTGKTKIVPRRPSKSDPKDIHRGKPEPSGAPEVWAESRAALCNALDYFRSHQSSLHSQDGVAVGMMIDSKVGEHDMFSSQVIITSIGGGCARDDRTGEIVRVKSLDGGNAAVRNLTKAMDLKQAVVVIAGMGNKLWPTTPPHYYNVLDHFHITDIWPVKTLNHENVEFVHWMIRFEKINLVEKSWWTPADAANPEEYMVGEHVCPAHKCDTCNNMSKEKYKLGWTCLNNQCPEFFTFDGKTSNDASHLDYTDSFLRERTEFQSTRPLYPLVTALPTADEDNGFGTGKVSRNGIVCPECRRCSRRLEWERWECETDGCNFRHTIPFQTMKPQDVVDETQAFRGRQYINSNIVSKFERFIGGYEAEVYYLPGEQQGELAGSVTIFRATSDICKKPQGPDDLFAELQTSDISLRLRSEQVTSHFQSNWGAYYKFGVVVKRSKGFDEAPDAILKGLHRLTWAGKTAIDAAGKVAGEEGVAVSKGSAPAEFMPFNELLSLGYFETSVIHYHDDGEKELSPTVATLSLGSPATMRFRPKKKASIGESSGLKSDKGNKKEVLCFTLNHGDMVVMHGTGIHKYYEHEVKPGGKLRYAMTCRHILLDLMEDEERRMESIIKGKIPDGSYRFTYHGEEMGEELKVQVEGANVSTASGQSVHNDEEGNVQVLDALDNIDTEPLTDDTNGEPAMDYTYDEPDMGDMGDMEEKGSTGNTDEEPVVGNMEEGLVLDNTDKGSAMEKTGEGPAMGDMDQESTTAQHALTLVGGFMDNIMGANEKLEADDTLLQTLSSEQRDTVQEICSRIAYQVSMARRQAQNNN
ncbi:hypothetical protein DL771_002563 [Monosporascus sp. 5C6A]|nr:hypothetical protein DL771_002563 [Monosporascus sp. 5C6A]